MKPYGIIYIIINKINGKMYIGQTVRNLNLRWNEHTSKKSGNIHLKNAITKYGKNNFSIHKLSICYTQEELDKIEQSWIKFFNTTDKKEGYNKAVGGYGSHGFSPTKETRAKISKATLGIPKSHYTTRKSKLTENQILNIRERLIKGESCTVLSKEFLVSKPTILSIKHGESIYQNFGKITDRRQEISIEILQQIRDLIKQNIKGIDIAKLLNISEYVVSSIKTGRRWKGVV